MHSDLLMCQGLDTYSHFIIDFMYIRIFWFYIRINAVVKPRPDM